MPFAIGAITGMPSQTRMYSLILPALMVLSIYGVQALNKRPTRRFIKFAFEAAAITVLIMSNSVFYQVARSFPGVWRLDEVRSYFMVPKYEKITYPVGDLFDISQLIYRSDKPIVLLRDQEIPQEYVNLIRYFGPRHYETGDVALRADPTNGGSCQRKVSRTPDEAVVFCTQLDQENISALHDRRLIFISAKRLETPRPSHNPISVLFETQNIVITELKLL